MSRFADDRVLLPEPGKPPAAPHDVSSAPAPGRLRVSWADGGAPGYEVRWEGGGAPARSKLVAAPDTQLDGLVDGADYRIEVRAVDGFGRRSEPAFAEGRPGRGDVGWRDGLTGLLDEFRDDASVRADVPGSLWHLSGYRGCVDLGARSPGEVGLPIDLGCGADEAVLRARQPMRLAESGDGMLGRFVVLTDAAGPGGRLTLDLVPGPADRVGAVRSTPHAGEDPTLPAGAIRVLVDDAGVRVNTGAGLDQRTVTAQVSPTVPARGGGVLHLFEVRVTTSGVFVLQDGRTVGVSGAVPRWSEASALIGMRGPQGLRARVHVAAAGFSGPPAAVPSVVERSVNLATRQVLAPDAPAPALGVSRRLLADALSARIVVTMTVSGLMDASAATIQLGGDVLPAPPAVPGPPRSAGSSVTVIAEVPQALLGVDGEALSPFVVRAPGAEPDAVVQESYLELSLAAPPPADATRGASRATRDALPIVSIELGDSGGVPMPAPTVSPQGRLVVTVRLAGERSQWDTGAVAGVQGFQLWADGRMLAGLPTSDGGPSPGGTYTIPLSLNGFTPGRHVLEVRVIGVNGDRTSGVEAFTVV
ncbi:fibronectin type III domain-containing protein [Actinokineospora xionganensis]|uniref:Fibronectin type III domain-containing protein n=1 Tax=Actinokineospora xionganensis TaxID=2684470 RepID=A0ABR7LFL8_9PSEU|nr:fibronectin type III domain-containing protein [Actinokineospora xionganensis]MBC6451174.1 fibronectin type III domain-containing protein [Actinokineospora xionganensis]